MDRKATLFDTLDVSPLTAFSVVALIWFKPGSGNLLPSTAVQATVASTSSLALKLSVRRRRRHCEFMQAAYSTKSAGRLSRLFRGAGFAKGSMLCETRTPLLGGACEPDKASNSSSGLGATLVHGLQGLAVLVGFPAPKPC